MKKTFIATCLATAGLSMSAAFSQTIVTSDSRAFTFTETLGSNVLTLDQFDDQGGDLTLTSIILTITYNVPVQTLRLDNDSDDTASGDFSFGEFGADAFSSSVNTTNTSFNQVTLGTFSYTTQGSSFSLDADSGTEGVGTLDIQPGDPDYFQFDTSAVNLGVSSWEIFSAVYSDYIGTGNITFDLAKAYASTITNLSQSGTGSIE